MARASAMIRSTRRLAMCCPPEGGADVQPLHLAALIVELSERDAPGAFAVSSQQIKPPLRQTVFMLKVLYLIVVILDVEIGFERSVMLNKHIGVLGEQLPYFVFVFVTVNDFVHIALYFLTDTFFVREIISFSYTRVKLNASKID